MHKVEQFTGIDRARRAVYRNGAADVYPVLGPLALMLNGSSRPGVILASSPTSCGILPVPAASPASEGVSKYLGRQAECERFTLSADNTAKFSGNRGDYDIGTSGRMDHYYPVDRTER